MARTRISYAPQLPLWQMSFSPLLTGAPSSPLLTQKKLSPRLHHTIAAAAGTAPHSRTRPQRPATSKPLPAPTVRSHSGPSHSPIVNLLNLLDRMDNDVSCEVQRVLESIRETRALVRGVKDEQRARSSEFLARRDHEKENQETKGVQDEFWLGV
ncbi:hypothetical protein C8Q72DRAFT_885826 [Fomitopsis betulina]|nr:hypothetical protein C8Q72DRAFT_885826 [Fomitopsis betulina]